MMEKALLVDQYICQNTHKTLHRNYIENQNRSRLQLKHASGQTTQSEKETHTSIKPALSAGEFVRASLSLYLSVNIFLSLCSNRAVFSTH